MFRLFLETKYLKWQYLAPAVLLVFSPLTASCLKQSYPSDSRRDQMVDSSSKVMKVLSKQLNLSKDRIMVHLRLDQIGVNQGNKLELQSALEQELKVEIPYKILDEKNTVGNVIRYVAIKSNGSIKLNPHSAVKLWSPPDNLKSNTKVKLDDDKSKNTDITLEQKQESKPIGKKPEKLKTKSSTNSTKTDKN